MRKKHTIVLFCTILIISVIIRIYNWPNAINDINCDEAMTIINANSIAENGTDIYGTTYPIYFEAWTFAGQSAFATYFIALFIKIFGFSLISVRLPILLISIIGIVFTILLVNKIFKDRTINIIVGILLAINPWHILQSAWVLDCNFFPHIMVIAIYCLLSGIEDKRSILLYISMIIFAITLYTYGVALYLTPIFLLIMAIYLLRKRKISIKKLLICFIIFIVFSTPIVIMSVINLFDLPTMHIGKLTIQNFRYSTRTSDMLIFSENKIQTLFENINSLVKILFLQTDGLIWNSFPMFGTIYLISLPIIIYGIIVFYLKNKNHNQEKVSNSKIGIMILLAWTIIGLACGILINGININRINIIWYILIIWNALGIYEIIQLIKHKKVFIIFIIILYFINFVAFMTYYGKVGTLQIANSFTFSRGLVDAIEYVDNIDTSEKIILSYNVCNSDKEYVFIKYATRGNQNEQINQEEFYKYYLPNERVNINLSTKEKEYIVQDINYNMKLAENVYILEKSEYMKIKENLEEYENNIFNDYVVLIKK